MDGAITGATDITLSGELDAATLDISSNADIDGTTNLDAVDIDGAVQLDSTFTVGENDTGYDVKFFGATSGAYMLWDESTDDLVLAGAAKLYLYDAAGGEYISSSGSALTLSSGGVAWELPAADGSADQLLKTDGSGNLDWTTVSVTGLSTSATGTVATLADAIVTLSPSTYVRIDGGATQAGEVRLYEDSDDGTNYVGFKAPNVGTSYTLTLPTATGSASQVLQTNGSSVLSWVDVTDPTALAIALG